MVLQSTETEMQQCLSNGRIRSGRFDRGSAFSLDSHSSLTTTEIQDFDSLYVKTSTFTCNKCGFFIFIFEMFDGIETGEIGCRGGGHEERGERGRGGGRERE